MVDEIDFTLFLLGSINKVLVIGYLLSLLYKLEIIHSQLMQLLLVYFLKLLQHFLQIVIYFVLNQVWVLLQFYHLAGNVLSLTLNVWIDGLILVMMKIQVIRSFAIKVLDLMYGMIVMFITISYDAFGTNEFVIILTIKSKFTFRMIFTIAYASTFLVLQVLIILNQLWILC